MSASDIDRKYNHTALCRVSYSQPASQRRGGAAVRFKPAMPLVPDIGGKAGWCRAGLGNTATRADHCADICSPVLVSAAPAVRCTIHSVCGTELPATMPGTRHIQIAHIRVGKSTIGIDTIRHVLQQSRLRAL